MKFKFTLNSRAFPIGHVTTRKDGSRWRKAAEKKWVQISPATTKKGAHKHE